MSYGGEYRTIPGLTASAAMTSDQYKIVKAASTAGQVKLGAAATDKCLGVLQNAPASGKAAEVAFTGIVKVLAEASVSYGDRVTCSTTGRAKTTTSAGNTVLGHALNTTQSSAGDLIPVLMSGIFLY